MRLSSRDQSFIGAIIRTHGLDAAWKGLLVAHIQAQGKEFAYILTQSEFKNAPKVDTDLLSNLSVGEVSILYEYALAYNDRRKRKGGGQYFTPDDVSKFLASHKRAFPDNAVWVDPCSGVGNLSYWLVIDEKDPEDFLLNRLFLIDLDPLALLTARVLFTIRFQKNVSNLFKKIEHRFLVRDFLNAQDLPRFDAAILNPPYVSGVTDEQFKTAKTRNMYAYFLERVASLCEEGYISITPQTFTNASSFRSLRAVILSAHKALDVYCFDNVPDNIFSGVKFGSENTNKVNSTRAGIIIARKASRIQHRITPLLRWRTNERALIFKVAPTFLTQTVFTEHIFPKISKDLQPLYRATQDFTHKLTDIITNRKTEYVLQVPSTPRYFISANKKPVRRTSFKTLYFESEKNLDLAYILLNSSYMYWWWRVNDGGMTISEKTLLDLPIPNSFNSNSTRHLVRELEQSEENSKVIKMNAGKATENIKHSKDLVYTLTSFFFPEEADFLSETHKNSHVQALQISPQQRLI